MTFLWPPLLLSLALIPLGLLLLRRIEGGRRHRVEALAGLSGAAALPAPRIRDRVAGALMLAAFVLLCLALARPQATVSLPRYEGTVMLTFDVSGSMAADDVAPSRLEQAKAVARAFAADQRAGVLIGVVAFSDGGLTVQVPTSDPRVVERAIDRLIPSLGTSLGQGMRAALDAIATVEAEVPASYYSNRSPAPEATPEVPIEPGSHDSAAIVLLTDGENTTDPEPLEVARAAAAGGIRVHTVGVGTAAGTVLELDGFSVHTRLDVAMLDEVARVTAGTYHPAADAIDSLDLVYDELGRRLTLREESIEITALVGGAGLVLLTVAGCLSLLLRGRLP